MDSNIRRQLPEEKINYSSEGDVTFTSTVHEAIKQVPNALFILD